MFVYGIKRPLNTRTYGIKDYKKWSNEWGGKVLFSSATTSSKGAMLLFRKHLKIEIHKTVADENGRYICVEVEYNQHKFLLVNLYAPNVDSPDFFVELFEAMQTFKTADRIICGDFNLTLGPQIDRNDSSLNNTRAQSIVMEYMNHLMLVDTWRAFNPDKRCFTWRRKGPMLSYSRIDLLLTNYALQPCINYCKIMPGFRSDHSVLYTDITCNETPPRGKGLWKFNVAHLKSQDFVEMTI